VRFAEQTAAAGKVQVAIVSDTEMKAIKGALRPAKNG
jgi:hypothetical protein